ncbi:unnamed protein product [Calypogeia fissa]
MQAGLMRRTSDCSVGAGLERAIEMENSNIMIVSLKGIKKRKDSIAAAKLKIFIWAPFAEPDAVYFTRTSGTVVVGDKELRDPFLVVV